MMYRTHALFGFLIGLLIYGLGFNAAVPLLIVTIAALIPDLDTPMSFLGRRLKIVSYPLKFFFEHRGFTHSFLFLLGLFFIGRLFFPQYIAALLIGCFSHIFLDCLTKDGVRLVWPFEFKLRGFLRTDGLFEKVFFVGMIMLVIGLIWKNTI